MGCLRAQRGPSRLITEPLSPFCTNVFMRPIHMAAYTVHSAGVTEFWGDPDVDGRIILRWIFRKWEGVVGTG